MNRAEGYLIPGGKGKAGRSTLHPLTCRCEWTALDVAERSIVMWTAPGTCSLHADSSRDMLSPRGQSPGHALPTRTVPRTCSRHADSPPDMLSPRGQSSGYSLPTWTVLGTCSPYVDVPRTCSRHVDSPRDIYMLSPQDNTVLNGKATESQIMQ